MKTADPAAELAGLEAITGRSLCVESCFASFSGVRFEGFVRADAISAACGTSARDVRAQLLGRAEDTIDALAEAGWHLVSYPRMEFTGDITPFMQTLDGEMVLPSQQHSILMKVRFEVSRAR